MEGIQDIGGVGAVRRSAMRGLARIVGAVTALGPLMMLVAVQLLEPAGLLGDPIRLAACLLSSAAVSLAGVWYSTSPAQARVLLALAFLPYFAAVSHALVPMPGVGLSLLLVAGLCVGLTFTFRLPSGPEGRARGVVSFLAARARASAVVSFLTWMLVVVAGVDSEREGVPLFVVSLAISLGFTWRWARLLAERRPRRVRLLGIVVGVALALGLATVVFSVRGAAAWGGVVTLAVFLLVRERDEPSSLSTWLEPVLGHPSTMLLATFLLLCVGGTVMLRLPAAAAGPVAVPLIDAAFTAVSAVCVTGLITLDTPNAFSGLGQLFLLVLIQLGGLGIMSFSTAALVLMGKRLSMRHEAAVAGLLSGADRRALTGRLRQLLGVTFGIEGVGAVVLTLCFIRHGETVPVALWQGIFTSVSAFCNAGFALQTTSLMPYNTEPLVLHTVAALIIFGGLSPVAVLALPRAARGHYVDLQVRVILWVSALLLLSGTAFYAAAEWQDTLAGMSFLDRLHNAWFQSVTLRTAGFNSVDLTQVAPGTVTMMLVMMFIGGSPGGTAGGIKTTTVAVVVLAAGAAIQGHSEVRVFGRSIGQGTVLKAMAISVAGMIMATFALIALQVTQRMPYELALFEVVSALGTVGLTIGGTPLLDGVGKIIIMACMFLGRVGPLTLFLFLAGRSEPAPWGLPEVDVEVG